MSWTESYSKPCSRPATATPYKSRMTPPRNLAQSRNMKLDRVKEDDERGLGILAGSRSRSSSTASLPSVPHPAKIDLKKEYVRFCRLYSSEPLDIVAEPLDKASRCQDSRDLITVDLKGRGLRGVDCIALARILTLDPPITHLNLSDCLLLPQGFQALIDGLCKNRRLRSLELRGNNIQASMTSNLGKLLQSNTTLKSLLLEWNCLALSPEPFNSFCDGLALNQGLEVLDLRNNQISAECAIQLAGALRKNKTLRDCDLRWNSIGLSGAKALWEALRFNFSLVKLSLGGNFIPDEVLQCIEHCLQQQSEREAMMEEYSRRTTLLTRQLQRTEKDHAQEINTIVSVFDAEEAEFKKELLESHQQIQKLTNQLRSETLRSHSFSLQIEKLQASVQCLSEKEEMLQKALEIKEEHSETFQVLMQEEMNKLKGTYETKLEVTLEELEGKCKEIVSLKEKTKKFESELELKTATASNSQQEVNALQNQLEQNRLQYEDRLTLEKEKWSRWKNEVETSERHEIRNLENEIQTIQQTMMNHIKAVEKGKVEAEEEIRNLKISFVTLKAEAEEEQNQLRLKLKSEYESAVKGHGTQVNLLKEEIHGLENELEAQRSMNRKLESENTTLLRQNENLRQQLTHLDSELNEKDSTINQSLARARAEVREQLEQLSKEESANKQLRSQNLDLQQQVAILTVKQNRFDQERNAEVEHWKAQVERQGEELNRIKEEDMRRAGLLHEAFLAYMRSTAAATGLPLPISYYPNPNNQDRESKMASTAAAGGDCSIGDTTAQIPSSSNKAN